MINAKTKELILNATIELLSENSIDNISIRQIAAKAGTNSAGISYYFGNKENLIFESMKFYWSQLCDIYEEILKEKQLTPEKTKMYCKRIMQFYFSSKGIIRSEQSTFVKQGMDKDTKDRIMMQLSAVSHIVKALKPDTPDKDIPVKAIRFISSLAHPALWVENYDKIAPADISFDDFLDQYIKDLIKNI